jgi:hypothetical protein
VPQTPNQQQRRNPAQRPSGPPQRAPQAPVLEETEQDDQSSEDPFDQAFAGDAEGGYQGQDDDENLPDTFDLSDIAEPEFEVLPAGTYEGYVDSVEYGVSQRSGQPMLTWRIIVARPSDGTDFNLLMHTSFSDKAISRTKQQLLKLKPDLDLKSFRPGDAGETFGGMNVRVVVRVQNNPPNHEFPGKRNQVRELLPAQGSFLS